MTKLPNRPQAIAPVAHRVVDDVVKYIIEQGWRVGHRLGNEAEISAMLGVGRAAFREAALILERQGVIRMVPGIGGGLVVEAAAAEALSNILRNYLELTDVSFDELVLARGMLEHIAMDLVLDRLTPARLNDLRPMLRLPALGRKSRDKEGQQLSAFQLAVVEQSGNPALAALCRSIIRLIADFGHQERYPPELWSSTLKSFHDLDQKRFEALSSRNPEVHKVVDETSQNLLRLYSQLERLNRKVWRRESFLQGAYRSALIGQGKEQKAALKLSYEIAAAIRRQHLPPGFRIGNAQDIAARHSASNMAVVEALRMLEFLGIVRLHRGRGAGVEVIVPDPTTVLNMAIRYLAYIDPLPKDIRVIQQGLEQRAIAESIGQISDSSTRKIAELACSLPNMDSTARREAASLIYCELISINENRAVRFIAKLLSLANQSFSNAADVQTDATDVRDRGAILLTALNAPDGAGVYEGVIGLLRAADSFLISSRI